jgi:para-nitrobenzyl esterase
MQDHVAHTTGGDVRGFDNGGISCFRGVPYAAAPVGPLRFRAPQSHAGWSEVRDAQEFGAVAPQNRSMESLLFGDDAPPASEDCLTLNIWSPAGNDDDIQRPVMVWFHGGAYVSGSSRNPWYDGTALATEGDVVVVTVNYRIGVLGFCQLTETGGEAFAGSGNLGLLDQIAALAWVQENIAAFGGDPDSVTIFGTSAGGGSVMALLAAPAADGLFHRAIAQSASFGQFRSLERATEAAKAVLDQLDPADAGAALLSLLTLDTAEILVAQAPVEGFPGGITAFAPTPDGVVLLDDVVSAVTVGRAAASIPLLIGTNQDEMRMFTAFDPNNAALDRDGVVQVATQEMTTARAEVLVDAYHLARPELSWGQIASALVSDHSFHQPAIAVATQRAGYGDPTWMYRLTWATPAFGGILGSNHALELPFVFGTLHHPGAQMLTGGAEGLEEIGRTMRKAWLSFARTGNPGWTPYDEVTRTTMRFDHDSCEMDDPDGALRQLWEAGNTDLATRTTVSDIT